MIKQWIRRFLAIEVPSKQPVVEVQMITVEYRIRVTAADGYVNLEMEKDKQVFVPRVDDTIDVVDVVQKPDNNTVYADVVEVIYDVTNETVIVHAETGLDLSRWVKIDQIVESALADGWTICGGIQMHGS